MTVLLITYCLLIVIASLVGGWLPMVIRLTHKRMELALSFVSGVMLGVALLHLLPHAWLSLEESGRTHSGLSFLMLWLILGFMALFLLERFFCFHHHESPESVRDGQETSSHDGHAHEHDHDLTWTGAFFGLVIHSVIAGVALGASVRGEWHSGAASLAGFGTFLVIFLHKPFDSLTIGTLLARTRRSHAVHHGINIVFGLAVPAGVGAFLIGGGLAPDAEGLLLPPTLAFCAGAFLCIALSDVLPELQFHQHDRWKLTLALVLGLALALGISVLESQGHDHEHDHEHSHDTTHATRMIE